MLKSLRMIVVLLVLICSAGVALGAITETAQNPAAAPSIGSQLFASSQVQLTDAAATWTEDVYTGGTDDLRIDAGGDKGFTVVVTPLPLPGVTGKPSTTGTIAAGGGEDRWNYLSVGAPYARVTVTKTEAGPTTTFWVTVRGMAN